MATPGPADDTSHENAIMTSSENDSGENGEDEQLLAANEDGVNRATKTSGARHHRHWLVWSIFLGSAIATFTLAGLLLSLDPAHREPDSAEVIHEDPSTHDGRLLRPDADYILDPHWDFDAPRQVRSYDWTISEREGCPDGVCKSMLTIDGQFPGPLIEANEGDVLLIYVLNQASNATSVHWHGLFQNGSNWMDGASGITQCPIAAGTSYTYRFNVTGQAGTYFYHGHQGVQSLDGLVGPLVIHSRSEAAHQQTPYSSDRVILLQDWYYDSSSGLMRDVLSPGVEDAPIPNTALINGADQAVCEDHADRKCVPPDIKTKGMQWPTMSLTRDQNHRLRFLNVGAFAWFQVAIDEHDSFSVIEVDGTTVESATSSSLVLAPGQRYSAILTANHAGRDAFWLRAEMVTSCFAEHTLPENGIEEAKAIIRYVPDQAARRQHDHGGQNGKIWPLPESPSSLEFLSTCRDMSATTTFSPSPPQPAPAFADHSWYLRVNLAIADWQLQRGVMNSSSFRPNLKSPTLQRIIDGLAQHNESFTPSTVTSGVMADAFDPGSELVISTSPNSHKIETIDIILQNMDENSHPFHLHGMPMWIISAGHGYFPGYEALNFRKDGKGLLDPANTTIINNPLKRDTVTAEGFGWVFLRFVADNPGAWLFHCHVLWHSEAGMGMVFLSRPDVVRGWILPDDARALCEPPEEELRKGAPPKDEVFYGSGEDEDNNDGR